MIINLEINMLKVYIPPGNIAFIAIILLIVGLVVGFFIGMRFGKKSERKAMDRYGN